MTFSECHIALIPVQWGLQGIRQAPTTGSTVHVASPSAPFATAVNPLPFHARQVCIRVWASPLWGVQVDEQHVMCEPVSIQNVLPRAPRGDSGLPTTQAPIRIDYPNDLDSLLRDIPKMVMERSRQ